MYSQDKLTEDQIIELREKVESNRLAAAITSIIIGGMCLTIGIVGIYFHVAMTIFGFVSFVISLIIGRVLWNEVRGLDWVLPQREKKEKDSLDLDLEDLDWETLRARKTKKSAGND